MHLTARLPNRIYVDYLPNTIGLGTPLHFYLDLDTLVAGDYDSPTGWYQRLPAPQEPGLQQVVYNQYAFCGRVQQVDVHQEDLDIYYFVLLDCGIPISFVALDLEADAGSGDLGQHVPDPGVWLSGVGRLSIDWGDKVDFPLTQTLNGTVTAIDRLVLRPGPGFGHIRPEEKLQPLSFAPDQIILTLHIINR